MILRYLEFTYQFCAQSRGTSQCGVAAAPGPQLASHRSRPGSVPSGTLPTIDAGTRGTTILLSAYKFYYVKHH